MWRAAFKAAFISILFTSAGLAETRVALVVGNSAYQNVSPLPNPTSDARLVAETLARLGFKLVGGGAQLDLDKPRFDAAVQAFGRQLLGADVGLFYYAGHGIQVRGTNYLVPISANPTREADVDFQMVDVGLVLRQMEGSGTKLNIVMLDACRNNPFGGRGLRAAEGGLAQIRAPEGTLLSYATQPGNVALDGDDGHSPYTRALVETMQKPGLDVLQAFNQVGLIVKRGTGGSQLPWVSSSPIDGSFYFASAAPSAIAAPVVAAEPPAPVKVLPIARSLEQRAMEFAARDMDQSSGDPATFLAYASQVFDDQVEFYGKTTSRADVLKEKERYVARWPVRSYRLLPEATRASCNEDQARCLVSGVVVFSVSDPAKGRKSGGTATFEYGVSFASGTVKVFSENGKTLSAQR
jgi:hypothetical protein